MSSRRLSALLWLFGDKYPRDREDLRRLVDNAVEQKLIAARERDMIDNVIAQRDLHVSDVMIPHGKLVSLDTRQTHAEVIDVTVRTRHSRYPVNDTASGEVVGILHVKRLVGLDARPDERILTPGLLQPALHVPDSKPLDEMLREFQEHRNHMVVVTSPGSGHATGVATIEDLLERIVGDIHDEFDEDEVNGKEPYIKEVEQDVRWELSGDTPLDKFNTRFSLTLDEDRFDTVGGWVAYRIGQMPKTGESVTENDLEIEVTQADERRVLYLEVTKRAAEPGAED